MPHSDKSSRNYFRVEYPTDVRPVISFQDGKYRVINLCEGGVKFTFPTREFDLRNLAQQEITATITFHNHDKSEVIGTIIRAEKDSIILKLSQGVSFQKIMAEQRFLLNKYGTLRRPSEP